jgi:hypothetical protein
MSGFGGFADYLPYFYPTRGKCQMTDYITGVETVQKTRKPANPPVVKA